LTTIVTASAAVGSPSLSRDERRELGESIGEQARRLSRLVDQLLDLSRIEAGTALPRRDWCSIEELIRTAVDGAGDGDRFAMSFHGDLPLIKLDAAQLERALANLLENAARYSEGYPVRIRAGAVGRHLVIRIVDRGPGISHTELARIFEPFYRGHADSGHNGSGLGLAIARGFVEANDGRLTAESLPGQGTTFVVELPLPSSAPDVAGDVLAGDRPQ
jgi:two-component system sensor histidine kinase KdpD